MFKRNGDFLNIESTIFKFQILTADLNLEALKVLL